MMNVRELQSWSHTYEDFSSQTLCESLAGKRFKTIFRFSRRVTSPILTGAALLFLLGFVSTLPAQTVPQLRVSEVTTPWTNGSGQAVESNNNKEPMSSVSAKPYHGIKTTELTITPLQIESPPIRLTQGVVSKETLPQNGTESTPKQDEAVANTTLALPKLAQSSGIPQPGDRVNRFLPPGSVLAQPGVQGNESQNRDRRITLPDGKMIDLSETESIRLPEDRRFLTPSNRDVVAPPNLDGTTPDPRLGPEPETSPTITDPARHRKVFGTHGFGRNKDGSMNGNPYAIAEANDGQARCSAADYRPGQIPYDPNTEGRTRLFIPSGAYGSDGWGNDGTACVEGTCGFGFGAILQNMQCGLGILGYTTPMDALGQGNFGADLSLNWSTPRQWLQGWSAQAGGRLTLTGENSINGSSLFQEKDNAQFFWTTGLFYRNPCSPWQLGIVYDSLNSSYLSDYTVGQIRTELSHKWGTKTDIGFLGAFRVNDALVNWWRINAFQVEDTIRPVSWYSGFIRHYFDMGGEGMIYGGVTENSEALMGGKIEVPISNYCSLKNDFTYVFSNEGGLAGQSERSWNVSVALILYFGGNCRESLRNPLRPLFDVANNGSLLQGRKR